MKRKLITFGRIVRTGVVNFGRNMALAIAAMAVMTVTLTIILFSLVANAAFGKTIDLVTDKINISVYLGESVTTTERNNFISRLRAMPDVANARYVSREEALANYREDNADNQELLKGLAEVGNPLPASIDIDPADVNNIQNIKTFLDKPENKKLQDPVAGTSYDDDRKEAVDKIISSTNTLTRLGALTIPIFGIVSVLIIFNTIQMAIFNRRDEIQIMRLLGASTSYIRGPFVVESIMYGVISALISVGIIHGLVQASSTLQAASLGLLDISFATEYFRGNFWLLLTGQLGIGILIGAASSIIATRRYLKFKTSK